MKHGFGTFVEAERHDESKKDLEKTEKKDTKKEGYWKNNQFIGIENPA